MKTIFNALALLIVLTSMQTAMADLPRVTGLTLEGNELSWDAQEGASGYNIHLNYDYYDTVRSGTSYTLSEPGNYHVISFNDSGEFGVTRNPDEIGQPYIFVEYMGSEGDVAPILMRQNSVTPDQYPTYLVVPAVPLILSRLMQLSARKPIAARYRHSQVLSQLKRSVYPFVDRIVFATGKDNTQKVNVLAGSPSQGCSDHLFYCLICTGMLVQ